MRRAAAAAGLLLLAGCASVMSSARPCDCEAMPAPWTALLQAAGEQAEAGRFDAADSTLTAYAAAHPETQEGGEVAFWRALYMLDPRNPVPQPVTAADLLDGYLLSGSVYWYREEARLLRQLAALRSPVVAAVQPTRPTTPGTTAPAAVVADKDVEILQLRAQVARLNEELERIKRRLSAP